MRKPESRGRTRAALLGVAAVVLTVAVFSTACQQGTTASPAAETVSPKRADMRTVTVPVDGMICMVCAGRVKNALKAIPGVQNAEVNLEKRRATVQYEYGKLSVDELTRVIHQLGYKAGVPAPAQLP